MCVNMSSVVCFGRTNQRMRRVERNSGEARKRYLAYSGTNTVNTDVAYWRTVYCIQVTHVQGHCAMDPSERLIKEMRNTVNVKRR